MKYIFTSETKVIPLYTIIYDPTETHIYRKEYERDITLFKIKFLSNVDVIAPRILNDTSYPQAIYHSIDGYVEGGWIENENNLSQEGTCKILGNAMVYNGATVLDDALVYHDANVFGDTFIRNNSQIFDQAMIYDSNILAYSRIYQKAEILKSKTIGYTKINGETTCWGLTDIFPPDE